MSVFHSFYASFVLDNQPPVESGLSSWIEDDGTVLQQCVFTSPIFKDDTVRDWLFFYDFCALKICNEAVVEATGNCLDMHSDDRRGLTFTHADQETVVDWAAPLMHEADHFISDALDIFFEGKDWHFTAKDSNLSRQGKRFLSFFESKKLETLKKKTSKFSFIK